MGNTLILRVGMLLSEEIQTVFLFIGVVLILTVLVLLAATYLKKQK